MFSLVKSLAVSFGIINLFLCTTILASEDYVVRNHQPLGRIIVGKNASSATRFAVDELRRYLKKVTGAELPVSDTLKDDGVPEIIIDNGVIARSLGVEVKDLPYDGFRIKKIGKRLLIAGRDDPRIDMSRWLETLYPSETFFEFGTGFGVYEFLERYLGIRWYLPGELGVVLPKRKDLALPNVDITEAPDKKIRFIHPPYGADEQSDPPPLRNQGGWVSGFTGEAKKAFNRKRKLHFMRMRHQTVPNIDSHNLGKLISPAEYAESHPEYFATYANGSKGINKERPNISQYCYTCPGLIEQLTKVVKASLKGESAKSVGVNDWNNVTFELNGRKAFCMLLGDGYRPCECTTCREFRNSHKGTKRQVEADLIWNAIIKVAKEVQRDFPSAYIATALYGPLETLPTQLMPENIVVSGFARTGPYDEFIPELKDFESRVLKRALNVFGKQKIAKFWIYPMLGGWENGKYKGTPFEGYVCASIPRSIGEYFKRYKDIGDGTYAYFVSHNYAFDHLNIYTFYKMHWDVDTDVDELLSEYYALFYGPAAKPMRKFWSEVEQKCSMLPTKVVKTPLGPIAALRDKDCLWGEIYNPEILRNWRNYFDEALKLAKCSPDSIYLKRVEYMKRNVLDVILDARKAYDKKQTEIARLTTDNDDKNIMGNSGFDGELTGRVLNGWYVPCKEEMKPGVLLSMDASTFVKGNKSLKMTLVKGQKKIALTKYLPPMKPDTDYLLTFYVKTENVQPLAARYAGACISVYDGEVRFFPSPKTFFYTGTIPWKKCQFTFRTGNSAGKDIQPYVSACVMNAEGTVWFDDIKIIPIEKNIKK